MIDLDELQNRIYQNKIDNCFDITDAHNRLCYSQGGIFETFETYVKNRENSGKELVDIAVCLLGLSEILNIGPEIE